MKTLKECREEIDDIDTQIISLFEKRMDVVKEVILFKKENAMPIVDNSREDTMLEKNIEKIKNSEYEIYYELVLKGFLEASKKMQSDLFKK